MAPYPALKVDLCEECRTTFWGRNEDRLPETVLTLKPCLWRGFFLAIKKSRSPQGPADVKGGGQAKAWPGPSFDGDLAAHFFHGLLDGFGFSFRDAFLDGLGSSFHKGFGFA